MRVMQPPGNARAGSWPADVSRVAVGGAIQLDKHTTGHVYEGRRAPRRAPVGRRGGRRVAVQPEPRAECPAQPVVAGKAAVIIVIRCVAKDARWNVAED